jgi:steroid delta-isomerase-like uncharacterized protein
MSATTQQQLDRAFVEDWGQRFGDAWNDHDPDAILALCTDDVVWNDAALPGPVQGHQALRDFATATFATFPDFRVEETADGVFLSPIEPLALCPYRMSGTMLGDWGGSGPSKASFAVNGIDQWTFRGELLCHYVTYYDHADMVRQLASGPAAGAAS